MISHTSSGLLEEKTNGLPLFKTTITASPNDVVYANEPSKPYLTPTPQYLPKEALILSQEEISFNKNDFRLKSP
jgi:hypothetical protein